MSLRRRLTLLTVAAFVVGLGILVIAIPSLVSGYLYRRLDDDLRNSAQVAWGAALREVRLPATRQEPFDRLLSMDAPAATGQPATSSAFDGSYIELRDGSGTVLASFFANRQLEAGRAVPDLPAATTVDPGEPFTVASTSDDGPSQWRVVEFVANDADGDPLQLLLAVPTTDVEATVTSVRTMLLVASGVTVVGLVAVTWWLIGVGLRPLRAMEQSAATISHAEDLGRRVEHPADSTELGRLGVTINEMLGRLETSFADQQASEARLRRFVADASHELRTPLTSIRGYAELYRRGGRSVEQVERSMDRIEGEGARMSLLVEDLLLLARFDEGLPLEHDAVDMATVARDSVDDARAAQPDRRIDVEPCPATVVGDRHRLTQAVANLLANARVHTPATSPVRVSVERQGRSVLVRVIDRGPGLPPGAEAKVFDRFHRIDPSRTRAHGGSGLGLAITRSIVEAHGGTINVETTPGGGATFVVALPAAAAPGSDATTVHVVDGSHRADSTLTLPVPAAATQQLRTSG